MLVRSLFTSISWMMFSVEGATDGFQGHPSNEKMVEKRIHTKKRYIRKSDTYIHSNDFYVNGFLFKFMPLGSASGALPRICVFFMGFVFFRHKSRKYICVFFYVPFRESPIDKFLSFDMSKIPSQHG